MRERETFQNTANRPSRMLGDERFWVKGCSAERRQVSIGPHISESDTDVSQKSPAFDAFDRRAAEKDAELDIVEGQVVAQWHLCGWPGREGGFARSRSEAVPRAGVQAIIATIDAIADKRPQLERDRAF